MDLLPELGTLAEFGALCSAQSSIDQPYDDQAAILAGLSFAEQLDASLLDRACIVTLLTALQQIVARYYECNIFNAVAVRSWKLLCGAITKVDFSEADGVQLVWEKAATVIASLAADTLDSLLADLTTFDIGVAPSEADLQPVAGKMKFLGFTAQRSVELLSVTWTGMTSLQQCPCMVTLLRTIGTFNLVAGYSSMFDELIVKSVEAAGDLLNPQRIPITALSRILSACEHAGYDLHIGLCKLMLHLVYSGALEAAGASTVLELGSVIATVVHGLCCLATACTGALSDAYLEDLIREVAEALSALLANAPDAGTLQSHMVSNISDFQLACVSLLPILHSGDPRRGGVSATRRHWSLHCRKAAAGRGARFLPGGRPGGAGWSGVVHRHRQAPVHQKHGRLAGAARGTVCKASAARSSPTRGTCAADGGIWCSNTHGDCR